MLLDVINLAVMIFYRLIIECTMWVDFLSLMVILLEPDLVIYLVTLLDPLNLGVISFFVVEDVLKGHYALLIDQHHVFHLHDGVRNTCFCAISVALEQLFEVNSSLLVILEDVLRLNLRT